MHPGKPLYGEGPNEARFDLLMNDLMPLESTLVHRTTSDYDWHLGEVKHTLKEFEKPIYYSNGDYKNCYTNKFSKNLLTGFVDIEKQLPREAEGPGYFLFNSAGFRASGHLSAPTEDAMTKKFKRLGHVREHKLVGWDLQKPRDNRMYYVGEGEANLRKMDKHIKRKQGSTHLFAAEVINDNTLRKLKKKKVRATADSVSRFKKSMMQHSQRSDDGYGGPNNMSRTTADTALNRLAFRGGSSSAKDALNATSTIAGVFSGGFSTNSGTKNLRIVNSAKAQDGLKFKARIKSDYISPNDLSFSQGRPDKEVIRTLDTNVDLRKPLEADKAALSEQ